MGSGTRTVKSRTRPIRRTVGRTPDGVTGWTDRRIFAADGEFDAVVAANVLHLVPDLPAAIQALRSVMKLGGVLVAPTFCHDETRMSWLVSRILAVSGFPGHRRFTMQSLRNALEDNGLQIVQAELLPGLIPIGFVKAAF